MLLNVENMSKFYTQKNNTLFGEKWRLSTHSFNINSSEAFGLVGESGSGKAH